VRVIDGVRVGRIVRAVRLKRHWRQVDVAERAGVSETIVSRIERGRLTEVSIEALEKVAAALDIHLTIVARWRGGDLDRMLNARHANLAERAIAWLNSLGPWVIRPEVSFSFDRERGIVDLLAWWPDRRALLIIELKTDIVDVGELVGTFRRKLRLARRIAADQGWQPDVIGACLLIDEGRTNRRRVAEHALTLRAFLPDDGRRLRAWLRDPQGTLGALAFLPDPQSTNLRRNVATVRRVRPGGRRPASRAPNVNRV
jgi:transcriptional regulator with XRE-family HTH domain